MEQQELLTACSYIASELNRIQTVAGTLAQIEREHHTKLTGYEDRELLDIAVEEQSAARQLGMVRHVCLELSQKVEEMQQALGGAAGGGVSGGAGRSPSGGMSGGAGDSLGSRTGSGADAGPDGAAGGGRTAREAD